QIEQLRRFHQATRPGKTLLVALGVLCLPALDELAAQRVAQGVARPEANLADPVGALGGAGQLAVAGELHHVITSIEAAGPLESSIVPGRRQVDVTGQLRIRLAEQPGHDRTETRPFDLKAAAMQMASEGVAQVLDVVARWSRSRDRARHGEAVVQ